jgi:glutamate racemase
MSWFIQKKHRKIGVFDSGIGGLTVVGSLMRKLPEESIVYFGDTARVPYGIKSSEVVREYALEDAAFLMQQGVKMIVVACNTVSAVAMDLLREKFSVPVVGMIDTGTRIAARTTRNGRVGVIGTLATIASGSYEKALMEKENVEEVVSKACPLFVPLAEEGWGNHKVSRLVAKEYLEIYRSLDIDTMIMGCTHYPILKEVIREAVGESVFLVDSGDAAAEEVAGVLGEKDLLNDLKDEPQHEYYVSDVPQRFRELGEIFLGKNLTSVGKVHLR